MKESVAILLAFLSIAVLAGKSSAASVAMPDIVPKAEWGSMKEGDFSGDWPFDPYSQGPLGDPVAITIHHTAQPLGTHPPNAAEDIKKIQWIQQFHAGKGWGDVGYHFVIGSDGTIYEGRPLGYMGTHAPPNSQNIGVNVIGDFHTEEYPSDIQLTALLKLTTWLCDKYDIDPTSRISIFEQSNLAVCGHRDWGATACPGDRLYALIPNVRDRIRAGLLGRAPAYDGRISVTQFLPQILLAGQQYELPIAVRNTGFVMWSYLNQVKLQPATDILAVAEPVLKDKEDIATLANRTWQVSIKAPNAGPQHLALRMMESDREFGSELAWDANVLSADDLVSQWLALGPFPGATPDAAYMVDHLAGKALDTLDVMEKDSESAHNYAVTGEYSSGERNYRGEDGERVKETGRYWRGEESFKLSLAGYKGGDLALRRLIDADTRDQMAVVYLNGHRFTVWKSPGMEQYRLWKNLDLVIPAYELKGKDSLDVRLRSIGTVQWGNDSFKYTLLDSSDSLAVPKSGEKIGSMAWKSWKSGSGITDLSAAFPGVESGAVYLTTYVKSPVTKWAEVRVGYQGCVKAWLNGQQAIGNRSSTLNFPDTKSGEALLKRGWNRLLVKVVLEPGMKDLYVRICDKDGQPIEGLKSSTEPSDRGNPEWVASNQ